MKWKTRRKDSNAVVTLCIQFITWFRLYDFSSLNNFFSVYGIILSQLVSRCFVAFGSFLYVFLIRIRVYCYLFLGLLCMNECYIIFFVVDDNTKLDTFVLNNSLWRYTFTKTTFWLETMTSCIYMYTLFLIFCCLLGTSVRFFLSCYKYIITTENTRQTPSRKFSSSFVLCTHSRNKHATITQNREKKKIIFINEVL